MIYIKSCQVALIFNFQYHLIRFQIKLYDPISYHIMILLIGSEKGGTGKTTLVTNLAALLVHSGRDTLLVDTDQQGSASYWAATRDEHPDLPRVACVQKAGKGLARELQDLSTRYDEVLVDAGGRDSAELRASMVVADRLVIPIQASQFDMWTLEQMDRLVEQARTINESLRAAVVLNRASTHTRVTEADDASTLMLDFDHLEDSGVVIRDRIIFRRAASLGLGVVEYDPPDPKASTEILSLFQSIYDRSIADLSTIPGTQNLT